MGRFASVIARLPVHELSASVEYLSASVTNLIENMPSTTENMFSLCCFRPKHRREPEIVISELVNITPQEDIDEEELEIKFAELVDELDLSASNRTAMLNLPIEKKWQIYCSRKNEQPVVSYSPEYYTDRVRAFMPQESAKLFESLKTSLRTQPHSFVQRYLELDGLEILLERLRNPLIAHSHSSIIGCLKSLLNNSTGRAHVLAHGEALNIISESLGGDNARCKVDVLEILGAVCLVPGGHRRVLEAVSYFQEYAGERTRFQTIINDLDRSTGPYKQDIGLKTAIMSFLNAILSYGPGQECAEFRLHLRYELLMLGIVPTISKLRNFENVTLDKHLDFFEMMRAEDEKELARRIGTVHVDTTNVDLMFNTIKSRWSHSLAFPNLQSILVHLLLIPGDTHWILLDRILQQIVLHPNTDRVMINLNIDDIVKKLASEAELMELESKLNSVNVENGTVIKKLYETEQQLEMSIQERERLQNEVIDLTHRCNYFQSNNISATSNGYNSSNLYEMNGTVPNGNSIPSPPSPHKAISLSESILANKLIPKLPGSPPNSNGICPPPPPPPPPFMGSLFPPPKKQRKPVPVASAPLKSFNWSKLPESKLSGTLWSEIEEEYSMLDLGEVDRLFSAYQKQNGLENTFSPGEKSVKKLLSLIDSRRAQNCTILLSKLKMADEEICKAIISMDSRDQLPQDMIEQLLKFTPSSEERSLLEEQQVEELARADSFLLKISRITHYEERLFTLYYKKRFSNITQDLQSKMKTVLRACDEVKTSRKLKKILQIILSLGNYMNRGGRGNAAGFRLASLTRLADTKSNLKLNLLNYILGQIEISHPDLLGIEAEILDVKAASKVSLQELEKEMTGLRQGLIKINSEVEFQKSQALAVGDRYLPVTREFLGTASGKVESIDKLFSEMKWKFSQTVKLFGEDYTQIDEFFSIFDQFLASFSEAKTENDSIKKRKEEEEKKQTTLRRPSKAQNQIKNGSINSNGSIGEKQTETKGEFDDLISALRTGDVFSDLNDTRKRSRAKKAPDFDSRERIH